MSPGALLEPAPVDEVLEVDLGFVRSASGDTLSAEVDGISFIAGQDWGVWQLSAFWTARRTAGCVERHLMPTMARGAVIAEVYEIWRSAVAPGRVPQVPALFRPGADYIAWRHTRSRIPISGPRAYVDRPMMRAIVAPYRTAGREDVGPARLQITATAQWLVLSIHRRQIPLDYTGRWVGTVSVDAHRFIGGFARYSRRPLVELAFNAGQLKIDHHQMPGVWTE